MAAVETCEACRFDGAQYDLSDTLGTLRALGQMWRWAVEGIEPSALAARPEPSVWSVLEYAVHSAEVTEIHRLGLEVLLGGEDLVLPEGGVELGGPNTSAGIDASLDRLQDALVAEAAVAACVPEGDPRWKHTISTLEQKDDAARVAGRAGLPLRDVISLAEEAGRRTLRVVPEPVPDAVAHEHQHPSDHDHDDLA